MKLTDFGIARVGDGAGHTLTGEVLGTPDYISPEQALGDPATASSDLYSLGIVAHEMVTGRKPFDMGSPVATAIAQVTDPPPSCPPPSRSTCARSSTRASPIRGEPTGPRTRDRRGNRGVGRLPARGHAAPRRDRRQHEGHPHELGLAVRDPRPALTANRPAPCPGRPRDPRDRRVHGRRLAWLTVRPSPSSPRRVGRGRPRRCDADPGRGRAAGVRPFGLRHPRAARRDHPRARPRASPPPRRRRARPEHDPSRPRARPRARRTRPAPCPRPPSSSPPTTSRARGRARASR